MFKLFPHTPNPIPYTLALCLAVLFSCSNYERYPELEREQSGKKHSSSSVETDNYPSSSSNVNSQSSSSSDKISSSSSECDNVGVNCISPSSSSSNTAEGGGSSSSDVSAGSTSSSSEETNTDSSSSNDGVSSSSGGDVEQSSSSAEEPSSSSAMPSSSSATPSSSSVDLCADFAEGTQIMHYEQNKDQFCDPRDGKKYVYVTIDTQVWMAENLNYDAEGSKCYDDDEDNCGKYGRLYNWATAQSVCPSGWHLPEYTELTQLGIDAEAKIKLKANDKWNDYSSASGSGTDYYGFAALPGGNLNSSGYFVNEGTQGTWWSSTEQDDNNSYAKTYGVSNDNSADISSGAPIKTNLYSIRCIKDNN